ncbi:hypothetical protein [Paenibacillus sp. FSL R10-2734]|uniref:hypothetical protein n=1 Tax=Paenibacillus sp. FSL R10-2734 TaxID=2954691 RepID=UPI0030DC592A
MHSVRNIGGMLLVAGMLWLTACSVTPETGTDPKQTQEQSPTEQPLTSTKPTQTTQEPTRTEQSQETQEPSSTDQVQENQEPSSIDQPQDQEGLPPSVTEAASTVMNALKNKDMNQLAAWVHSEKGLRFSPYAYVDTKNDIVFTKSEVEVLMNDTTKRVWRTFAGSGDLIELTFADYYKQFVYDADFIQTAEIAVNKGLGQGTTINNLNEVYPKEQYDFVEYHIAGIDPSVEGMDWRSLRLVFEKIGEDHALVGIIHDQWTP